MLKSLIDNDTLQRLAAGVVIVATVAGGVFFVADLRQRVASLEGQTLPAGSMPAGTMLPYAGSGGTADIPRGWVLCGSGGTPEMDGLFLRGTNEAKKAGLAGGEDSHVHDARFRSTFEVEGTQDGPEGADNYTDKPNWNHKHDVEGKTEPAENLPRHLQVLFFCKE